MVIKDLTRGVAGMALVAGVTTFIPPITIGPGFFNFSDAIIMIIALMYGWKVGLIAAFGAAIGDFNLGYAQYIPFTIVTKPFTGFIIGKYRDVVIHNYSKRIILTTIAMLFMIATYLIGDYLIGEIALSAAHITGNIIQAIVSIILFDIFARRYSRYIK